MLAMLPLLLGIAPEIARWIGGSQAANVTAAVTGAVKAVTGTDDPQAAAAALAADSGKAAELRVQLAKIAADAEAAQRQADLEEIKAQLAADAARRQAELETFRASIADTQSARGQTIELAKSGSPLAWGAPVISLVIVTAFGLMLFVILRGDTIPPNNLTIANVLLGTLAAMATQVANYWLGSSSGSKNKDGIIRDAQDRLAASVPPGIAEEMGRRQAAGAQGEVNLSADDLNALSLSRARRD